MRYSIKIILLLIIAFTCCCDMKTASDRTRVERAVKSQREQFRHELIHQTIYGNLKFPVTPENEDNWMSAFWGMELGLYRSDSVLHALKRVGGSFSDRSHAFQRSFLEAAYCLYPDEFITEVRKIADQAISPKIFAMAVLYLKQACGLSEEDIETTIIRKFPQWQNDPILLMLMNYGAGNSQNDRPPLVDLLAHPFEKGKIVIYSFQRQNRNYTGLTIIRKGSGTFLRREDGSIFSIPHFARSVSALPGFLTNGNTPQGILSIQETDVSENVFIGPTPNLQLVLPYEVDVGIYFHDDNLSGTEWTIEDYNALLPKSWQNALSIHEAYYAGQAGRTEIISHGTTIDPNFYINEPYFPNTPSLGCLTALELWSEKDGRRLHSNQAALMNEFKSWQQGYFVVVDLDDKKQPVHPEEIIDDILTSEKIIAMNNETTDL